MTMLSFRIDADRAAHTQAWATELGIDRSQLLRDALHEHLTRLEAERDVDRWEATPLSEGERALGEVADWGPAEDWSDWSDGGDAAR